MKSWVRISTCPLKTALKHTAITSPLDCSCLRECSASGSLGLRNSTLGSLRQRTWWRLRRGDITVPASLSPRVFVFVGLHLWRDCRGQNSVPLCTTRNLPEQKESKPAHFHHRLPEAARRYYLWATASIAGVLVELCLLCCCNVTNACSNPAKIWNSICIFVRHVS